jgi:hypothetical protein
VERRTTSAVVNHGCAKTHTAEWEQLLVGHPLGLRDDLPDELRDLLRQLDEKLERRPKPAHEHGRQHEPATQNMPPAGPYARRP